MYLDSIKMGGRCQAIRHPGQVHLFSPFHFQWVSTFSIPYGVLARILTHPPVPQLTVCYSLDGQTYDLFCCGGRLV